jgi:hypothetical protein
VPTVEYQVPQEPLHATVFEVGGLVIDDKQRVVALECLSLDECLDGLEVLHNELVKELLGVMVSEYGVPHRCHRVLGHDKPDVVEDLAVDSVGALSTEKTDEIRALASSS